VMHHSTQDYSLLDWDSKFFGFNVAIIHHNNLPVSRLKELLITLKKKDVRLVYWPAASTIDLSMEQLKNLNGLLVDKKITFKIPLNRFKGSLCANAHLIERYNPSIPFTNLESLAIQCGEYSRYAVDPKIPKKKFIQLYSLWIEKSVTKQIADEVLILRKDTFIQALITLKKNKNSDTGKIGLLVVDKKYRGQGLGEQLIHSALQWFQTFNLKYVTVDTQGENSAACCFYQKCGFFVESVVNFYHFWI